MNPIQFMGSLANAGQMMQQFQQFKSTLQGNPQQMIEQMVQSGQISQEQLTQAQQMARQFGSMLGLS